MLIDDKPWLSEPNEIDFIDEDSGYPCVMRRNPMGAWCGYVGLTVKHPWFGMKYGDKVKPPGTLERAVNQDEIGVFNIFIAMFGGESVDEKGMDLALCVRCHGGITFSDQAYWNQEDTTFWWLGFDCAHCDDYQPKLFNICPELPKFGVYRDEAYVRKVLKMMCADLKVAEMFLK